MVPLTSVGSADVGRGGVLTQPAVDDETVSVGVTATAGRLMAGKVGSAPATVETIGRLGTAPEAVGRGSDGKAGSPLPAEPVTAAATLCATGTTAEMTGLAGEAGEVLVAGAADFAGPAVVTAGVAAGADADNTGRTVGMTVGNGIMLLRSAKVPVRSETLASRGVITPLSPAAGSEGRDTSASTAWVRLVATPLRPTEMMVTAFVTGLVEAAGVDPPAVVAGEVTTGMLVVMLVTGAATAGTLLRTGLTAAANVVEAAAGESLVECVIDLDTAATLATGAAKVLDRKAAPATDESGTCSLESVTV